MGDPWRRPREVILAGRAVPLGWCEVGKARWELLSPAEQRCGAQGKTAKRRNEFCAGRIAAREAVSALLPEPALFDILAREEGTDAGRPFVKGTSDNLALSISHSGEWAVAAASPGGPLGVDLESGNLSREPSFLREAFAPGELEAWACDGALSEVRVALAWAAKEAALKVWGVGLRAPLGSMGVRVELVDPVGGGWAVCARVEIASALPNLPPPPGPLAGWLARLGDQVLVLLGVP